MVSTLDCFDDSLVRTPGMRAIFASLEPTGTVGVHLFHIRGTMVGRDCRIDMVTRVGYTIDGLCTELNCPLILLHCQVVSLKDGIEYLEDLPSPLPHLHPLKLRTGYVWKD
jgi:hypothetical protein